MSNPTNKYNNIAIIVNTVYNLIKITEVCLIFGVICSVFPSAKYNLFKLTIDGRSTNSKKIIPNPPNH